MKHKSIFQKIIFWNILITALCIAIVVGFSCYLIFHTKIFEKWGRTKVVRFENWDGPGATAVYIVKNEEYKHYVAQGSYAGHGLDGNWFNEAISGKRDLYISYLVSDPNYIFVHHDRLQEIIVCTLLWFSSVITSAIVLTKIYSKPKKKEINAEGLQSKRS